MKISVGDLVAYSFPDPVTPNANKFIGKVEEISDTFIFIKDDRNIRLRVSARNFDLINSIESVEKISG